jgi:hydrogenase maturation protein HypF
VAVSLLWELHGADTFEMDELPPIATLSATERRLFAGMQERGLSSPLTSSAGRLFDGVAALLGLRERVAFEGQAAMLLEFSAGDLSEGAYRFAVQRVDESEAGRMLELDWRPVIEAALEDSRNGVAPGIIAARFHDGLAEAIVAIARAVDEPRVALSGGCFQNRRLTADTARRLGEAGFEVLLHREVPANDGGISLGQVVVAAARLAAGEA